MFRDYNANGIKDNVNEPGVASLTITATFDGIVATAVSTSAGSYSFSAAQIPSGMAIRLEFTGIATGDFSGPFSAVSAGNGTSVQFVTAGTAAININFGVNYPVDYCESNPPLTTSCYVNGSISDATAPADVLVRWPYNSSGQTSVNSYLATKAEIGSTWGLAYARTSKTLYSAAFLKRHSGLGSNGLGAIYQITNANTGVGGSPTLLVDLTAQGINLGTVGTRDLGAPGSPNHDSNVYGQVGKIGLGGLDISDDESTLWTINLNQKALEMIPIATPTALNIQSYSITDPGCTGGTFRPFAVKYYRGMVYVGVICDANSSSTANLRATVYRFDPATTTFTSVLNFPLNYAKGLAIRAGPSSAYITCGNSWNPWSDNLTGLCNTNYYVYPEPILSDIEFDIDGSMILGFIDRFGHQNGSKNYPPGTGTSVYEIATGGDILRAYNNNGTFQLESNGVAGPVNSGAANNQGPGNSEFYKGEVYGDPQGSGVGHFETSMGGLAILLGSGEVTLTVMDPFAERTGGAGYLSNTTGAKNRAYQIYGDVQPQTFGKAHGLGDMKLLCSLAPIEIGNRVWLDKDKDGLQGPDELPLSGITVQLFAAGGSTPLATTVTNGNGLYVFKSSLTTALIYNTAYEVRIPTTQTPLASLSFTTPNNSGNDGIDSDFLPGATAAVASLTTGSAGQNVHSYDAGLICDAPTVAISPSQTVCGGTFSLPLSASVTSGTATGQQWYLTDAAGTSFTAIAGATSLTFTPTTQLPVAGTTRYFALTAYSSTSLCSATVFVSLTNKLSPTITFTAPASATTTVCANTTLNMSVSTNAIGPDQIRFVYVNDPLTSLSDAYTASGSTVLGTVTSGTATGTKTVTLPNAQLPDNQGEVSRAIYVYAILESADGLCQPVAQRVIVLNPRPIPTISGESQICQGSSAALTASGPVGMTFQWFLNTGTNAISTANPYSTTAINATATYRLRGTFSGCVSDDVQIALTTVPCTPCVSGTGTIGGVVYRDFNSDGIDGSNDPGMDAITVTIFRCDAGGSSVQVAQMQTDIKGQYSFTGLTGSTTYRVEFSNIPAGYEPTYRGTNNGTTAQFVLPGTCNASLGLNRPADYCQTNPRLVTPCYIDGAVSPNASAMNDVLVGFDYNVVGSAPTNKTTDATRTDIGSTWGLAYAKSTKQLYASAFLKRHIGLKDAKLGQIYVKNYNTPSAVPTPWLDISTLPGMAGNWTYLTDAQRGLGNAGLPSLDADAFDKIALTGIGDIDISDDDKTLFVMDLTNRQLLSIDIATKTLNSRTPVPDVCTGTAGPAYYTASSKSFTATDGNVWRKGVVFDTDNNALEYAQTITNPSSASAGTTDATLYATSVYTPTSLTYNFPMGNGSYAVKMHFATNLSITNRNTTVHVEGSPVISGLDVYAASGNQANLGLTRSFTATVTDGVLSINVLNGSGSTYAAVSGFEITPISGQAKGVTRPFATKYRDGKVYVGAVCDASFSQNRDDLQASVFVFDPTTNSFNATPVISYPLTYLRGASVGASKTGSNNRWEPWTSVYPNNSLAGIRYDYAVNFDVYTQPVFSDIEFDIDGSMIMGFFDRFGNQMGATPNYRPDRPTSAGLTSGYGVVGGDVLRAYYNGSGFELENNAKEGISSSKAPSAGANNLQGPGGGEFYFGDALPDLHNETSMGGLALLPGSNELRLTSGDPLAASSGGILSLDNMTGAKITGSSFTLYSGAGGGVQFKANGLGDLELLCNPAPIQIGNRVWRDDNQNGIQDPCEPAIPGAVVKLYDAAKTTVIASATTNAAGEYYFSSATVVAGTSTSSVSTSLLQYNTTYGLVITSLGSSSVVTGLSLTNVSPLTPGESGTLNSGTTLANNDAKLDVVGGQSLLCIKLTTGGTGETNHTYDFGITVPPCAKPTLAAIASQSICQGSGAFIFPLVSSVVSNTVTSVQWYVTNATGTSFTAISGATSLSLSSAQAVIPAAGQIKYYALIGQNGLSASCSDTVLVNLYQKATQTIAFSVPASATTTQCSNTTVNLSVTTTAKAPDQIRFVSFTTPTADPYTGGTVLATITSGTLVTNTVSINNFRLPKTTDTDQDTLIVYAILVSADGLCQPVANRVFYISPQPELPAIGGEDIVCRNTTITLTTGAASAYRWLNLSANPITSAGTTQNISPTVSTSAVTYGLSISNALGCYSDTARFTVTPVVCNPCTAGTGKVGGNVFTDYNGDGLKATTGEPGKAGIVVNIYACTTDGSSSTLVSTVTTDLNGDYFFSGLTDGKPYRVEFTNLPAGFASTARGTNNGTTTQFVTSPTCGASLGINIPTNYCQTNPLLVTPCYLDGAVTPNTTAGTDVLVGVNYDLTGAVNHIATRTEMGSTWGVAYARSTKQLYTGAFLKRHVGLKDGKLGQIYVTNMSTGTTPTTPWLDVSTLPGMAGGTWTYLTDAQRGLGNAGIPSLDSLTFSKVASVGLGDVDISADDKTLYVMDLTNRQLLAIDIATKTLIGKYPVPNLCDSAPSTSYFSAGPTSTNFISTDGKEWKRGYLFDLLNTSLAYAQTITNPNSSTAGTGNAALYANSAYTTTTMRYSFPVGNGMFGVKLHLATNSTANGKNMTVSSEGVAVPTLTNFSTLTAAGGINIGITRSFTTSVSDGVLTLDFTNNTGGGAAMVSGFEITTLNGTPTGETRPFALAVHNDKVYVGAICDASHSQSRDDLQASVLEFNPVTQTYNPTAVLTFPLNYKKGLNVQNARTDVQQWNPWSSVYPNSTAITVTVFTFYTQPTLCDIVFDVDGSMILGFFDRFQHQQGAVSGNYTPDHTAANGRTEGYGAVGGDLIRAYFNGSSFEIENNAKEGTSSSKPATAGQNNGQGIGGGEFYLDDTGLHQEISVGGLAFKPGSGEVRMSAGDPVVYSSGGLTGFNNTTGAKQNGFTLFAGSGGGTQNKANGLGDLEVLCDVAPIQIGNRVWRDDNQDGIQDPCEPAIPGAVVKLYDAAKTTVIASATTNAAGEYYFSSATVVAGTSTSSVSTTLLQYNTTYGLVVTSLGTSSVVAGLSLTNVSPVTPGESGTLNSGTSLANNDAKLDVVGGISSPCIKLTTGGAGEINHTYDFGITIPPCAKPTLTAIPSQTICQGIGSFSFPLSSSVVSNTVTSVQWYLTNAAGTSFTAINGATSLSLSSALAVAPTVGQSKYYALIGQNGLSALCSDTIIVNLVQKATPVLTITTPSAATVTQCSSATMAFSVSSNAVTPDAISLVYFTSPQSGTAIYTGGTSLGTIMSTSVAGTKTLSFTATLPDNPTSSTTTIYVYAFLASNDGACKLSDGVVVNIRPDFGTALAGLPYICKGSSATLVALAAEGSTLRWSTGQSGVDLISINPIVSATATSPIEYSVTVVDANGCLSTPSSYTVTPVVCNSCASTTTTIGGTAFQDYNADGTNDVTDRDLSGITVTLFVCDPNGTSTQVLTTTTDLNGAYSFTGLTPGTTYRVEFSNFPAGYTPTYRGANNGSTVQFVQPGTCNASLGLNLAYDYCQTDPSFAVVCFARNNDGSTEPTIIDMKYSSGLAFSPASTVDSGPGWGTPINSSAANYPVATHATVATKGDMGTTFGLAWDRQHQQLLSGAMMRGFAPMQTNGSTNGFGEAIIYKVNYSTGAAGTKSVWLDLETLYGDGFAGAFVADATYPGPDTYGITNGSPAKIGYTGLGSMQMARDNHELYTVNLKTQEVLVIPVAADGSAVADVAQIKRFPLPTDGCPTGSWSDNRPYRAALGLGVHPVTNRVYATLTCTGPTLADMKGIVYSFDPSDASPSASDFRKEVSIPLDLDFPATNVNFSNPYYGQIVHPWDVVAANVKPAGYANDANNTTQNTQPWLGEIEFDRQANGTYGLMVGTRNRFHDIINSSFYVAGGALFRAFNDGSDVAPNWLLEQHGTAGTYVSTVNYSFTSGRAGFYTSPENRFFKYVGREGTMLSGTSDYVPGRTEIIIPAQDNVWNSSTSGITWLNRTTGDRSRDNHLLGDFGNSGFLATNFTKANNWGGLVVMCAQEPIQIGNRVWRDDNQNGIQDPCEPPISGAVVKLYDAAKTTVLASVTTNAAGEYYFSSTTLTAGTSSSSVATTALQYNTTYGLVITSLGTGTAASGLSLTDVSPLTPGESGSLNSGTSTINNDAKIDVVGGIGSPCIKLTTGGPGEVNHTYDFGIVKVVCSLIATAQASSGTVSQGQPVTLTAEATLAGSYTYAWSGAGTLTPANVATVVATNLPAGVNTFSVTVTSAPGCFTTAVVSVTVIPAPLVSVTVTPGVCQSATNQYSLTGTLSFSNAVAGTATITDGLAVTTVAISPGATLVPYSLTGLNSSTGSHTVTVSYAGQTSSVTYVAPTSCTVNVALTITDPGTCQSATNGYTATGVISLTNAVADLAIVTDGIFTTSISIAAGATSVPFSITGLPSGSGLHTVSVSYATQTASATYTAPASCTLDPVCSLSALISTGLCASATNTFSNTVTVTMTNPAAGTLTVSDGVRSVTVSVPAAIGTITVPAVFNGLVSDGSLHSVTVSLPGCSAFSQPYTAPVSCSVGLKASLGDYVWFDADADGQQDPTETGVSAVTVVLCEATSDTVISTTLTDGAGKYLFTNLNPGSYVVKFTAPAGTTFTTPNSGTDATDSDIASLTGSKGSTGIYSLSAGEENLTVDAGLIPVLGSIGDLVWKEVVQDGRYDAGTELGVPGVMVKLLEVTSPVGSSAVSTSLVSTTVTDGAGKYLFTDLPTGRYVVEFVKTSIPPTCELSPDYKVPAAGDALDSDADPATGRSPIVEILVTDPAKRDIRTVDAALIVPNCKAVCVPLTVRRVK